MTSHPTRVNMRGVSDDVEAQLRAAVRRYRRIKDARQELRQAILDAAQAGKGTSEITKLIDHEYTEAHVSRIIHGKA